MRPISYFIFHFSFQQGPFYISDTCVIKCSVTWRPPTFNTSVASWNCRCYHFEIIVKLSRNCGDDVDDDDDDVGCDDDDETDVHWALFAQRPPSLARLLRKPTRALLAIVGDCGDDDDAQGQLLRLWWWFEESVFLNWEWIGRSAPIGRESF